MTPASTASKRTIPDGVQRRGQQQPTALLTAMNTEDVGIVLRRRMMYEEHGGEAVCL